MPVGARSVAAVDRLLAAWAGENDGLVPSGPRLAAREAASDGSGEDLLTWRWDAGTDRV
jgi:hypothetical protein